MILVTTALMLEARPLRDQLGLKALGNEPFPVFASDDTVLVVTGTGSLKASAATAWAFARFHGITGAFNLGLAGAAEGVSPLYQWHVIHTIRDQSNGRLYIPDVLVNHGYPEAALLTVGKVIKADFGWLGLVDMEGSGFYEAARQFLSPDRIALFKWVSDPLSGVIDAVEIEQRFSEAIAEIVEHLKDWAPGAAPADETSTSALLDSLDNRLRLSRTQRLFLGKWIQGYLSRGGNEATILQLLPNEVPSSKRENNRIFEILKHALKS